MQFLKSNLAKNTIWMSFGLAGRIIFQIAYYLIVARVLGPNSYGIFAGAIALVTIFSPFVSWGSGNILVENVSRKPNQYKYFWGMALSVSFVSALALTLICTLLGVIIFSSEVALHLVLPMAIGMYFGDGIAILSSQSFQALKRLSNTSAMNFIIGFNRLLSALFLMVLPFTKSVETWAILFMLAGILSGSIGVIWTNHKLGCSNLNFKYMKGRWKEGFYFSIGQSAQGIYNDIDKTLLVRLVSDSVSGIYAAAYRIMDASFIPVRALLASTYPEFFKKGEKGTSETLKYAKKIIPWSMAWGVLAAAGIVIFANLIPVFLGEKYAGAVLMIKWLAFIPLFRSLHYLAADSLTGAGYQKHRSIFQICIAVVNLTLNLMLIPIFSWKGAAISSLASDGLLAICLWAILIYFDRVQTKQQNSLGRIDK